ncbi:MAG: hypothetical protein Q8N19_12765 [Phenylobacterium sp.]|uniref:hypothetical protein n=1 Tax=Phenylobacterium sp. TaxID=1871053 RepID=UPI002735C0D6|nr:hypothetical protein [Phenylobacterium sp.]MDP3117973.1 hypothetical protein [Phenylobacterium sp.]
MKSPLKSVSEWGNRLLLLVNTVLFGLALWFVCTRGLQSAPQGFSYQDLVTILLTAIAVILAAVTVFVALTALWGYTALKESAKIAAEQVARDIAEETAKSTAADAARALTMRELPGMVQLYLSTSGASGGDAPEDELAAELKRGGNDDPAR